MLAEDKVCTCAQYLSTSRWEDTMEHRAKIFYSLVIQGKLHSSVRWITYMDKGGFFQTGDICPR